MNRVKTSENKCGGQPPTKPWRRGLFDVLDRLAGECPPTLRCSADELHAAAVLLLVKLIGVRVDAQRDRALAQRWQLVEAACEWAAGTEGWEALVDLVQSHELAWLERELSSALPGVLAGVALSASTVRELLCVVKQVCELPAGHISAPAEQMGALHEALLAVRFERLTADAVRLKASSYWVQPRALLRWPKAVRAKRLQRIAGLSKRSVDLLSDALASATTARATESALAPLVGTDAERRPAGAWVLQPGSSQRRSGAHYTPWPLCVTLVERTLAPLVASLPAPKSAALLELKVCDPAMGVGAFLLAAGDYLARELTRAWQDERAAQPPGEGAAQRRESEGPGALERRARRLIVERVLLGVDKNPIAVALARLSLTLFADASAARPLALEGSLRCGDALVGAAGATNVAELGSRRPRGAAELVARVVADPAHRAVDWARAFPGAFERARPGLDVLIGNPPWVAFVGRAAQPLPEDLFDYFCLTNPAFKRYRTLHGLFVYRCAELLREGGRLGLVLPTSVADLDGYRETRRAHDALCEVDAPLPDWGDGAFAGVFQPSMALVSTRRVAPASSTARLTWPLARSELCSAEERLLERLALAPKLPPHLFGERGFQTTAEDQAHLRRQSRATPPFTLPLREGADVREFRAAPPSLFLDPRHVVGRLRPGEQWRQVALLIRQTARFPIAAVNDGSAFRNSILAGFADPEWPAPLLLCYLNSTLVRWWHYTVHRDARQGMPQLKIAHLRAVPALADEPRARAQLAALGAALASANAGVSGAQRERLDALVADAFGLEPEQRQQLSRWALAHPTPEPRRSARDAPALLQGVG